MHNDPEEIVTLALFYTEIEAQLIAQTLEEDGIEAKMAGGLTAGFRADAPGRVKVLVHAKNYLKAREIMEDYFKSREDIDWSKVDVGDTETE